MNRVEEPNPKLRERRTAEQLVELWRAKAELLKAWAKVFTGIALLILAAKIAWIADVEALGPLLRLGRLFE